VQRAKKANKEYCKKINVDIGLEPKWRPNDEESGSLPYPSCTVP
jgi:hypothetical protein